MFDEVTKLCLLVFEGQSCSAQLIRKLKFTGQMVAIVRYSLWISNESFEIKVPPSLIKVKTVKVELTGRKTFFNEKWTQCTHIELHFI